MLGSKRFGRGLDHCFSGVMITATIAAGFPFTQRQELTDDDCPLRLVQMPCSRSGSTMLLTPTGRRSLSAAGKRAQPLQLLNQFPVESPLPAVLTAFAAPRRTILRVRASCTQFRTASKAVATS